MAVIRNEKQNRKHTSLPSWKARCDTGFWFSWLYNLSKFQTFILFFLSPFFHSVDDGNEDDAQPSSLEECSICTEIVPIGPGPRSRKGIHLKCRHLFHRKCIKRWLRVRPTCPNCRKGVDVGDAGRPIKI